MDNLIYKKEAYQIIGLCIEVHKILGKGHSEIVYKDALQYEFFKNSIPFQREKKYEIICKDIILPHNYYADFVVFDNIVLEIKAAERLSDSHIKQTLNYIAAARSRLGLLVNFGEDSFGLQKGNTLVQIREIRVKPMKKLFKFILNTIPRPLLIRLSYVARPVLAFALKGSTYTDPIDGRSFKNFLPYGYGHQRNNVLSPSTLSLERHRLLWLYLKNETDFFTAPHKVLHFAPEQAFYKLFRGMKNLDYTTTDLYSPLADVKADICNLPFEDNAYDVILCNHVLEHIPDDTKAMQELYRVLKPGGMAILQIPQDLSREFTFEDDSITDAKERARIFGQYDHVRVYGRDYFNKLRSIGFRVVEEDYTHKLNPQDVERYCLAKGEIIPVCFKD